METLSIPEISESTSLLTNNQSIDIDSDTSERDRAVITLKNRRNKEKLRRRKQRQRIKDELESLRQMDDVLTLQLKKLKFRRETRSSRAGQYSIEKETALIHREERLKSEAEQRRLTTTMRIQASYIANLRRLFHPHQGSAAFHNALQGSVVNGATHFQHGDTDAPLFTSLLQKVDSCYAHFDNIMNSCGIVTMPLGVVNTKHWREENGELDFYQHLHKFELPSELEASDQYCWKAINFPQYRVDRVDYGGFGDAENTVAIKHRMVRTLATGITFSVLQRVVARRFIEQGRIVCIWKTYTEGEGIFHGMHSNRTGWSCIRPLAGRSGTLGEVCVRLFPVLFNTSPLVATRFHRFLQATLDDDKHEIMTSIHKRLLVDFAGN
ncbi:hypothetical protein PHMEG_0005297 [Phytophthora megakarya]|uniref:Uncharacterized protein n=1 Tax=Phytophthora megakarya TaxID=4795 RepID=A0A225WTA1_9STRA|nr:hypothetical protein PHMEG_0005297 [Phytophthora megakarya]